MRIAIRPFISVEKALPILSNVNKRITMRDAGTGLRKGIGLLNEQRQNQGQKAIAFGLDHFHTLPEGERGLRRLQGQASRALETAEKAKAKLRPKESTGPMPSGCGKSSPAGVEKGRRGV